MIEPAIAQRACPASADGDEETAKPFAPLHGQPCSGSRSRPAELVATAHSVMNRRRVTRAVANFGGRLPAQETLDPPHSSAKSAP